MIVGIVISLLIFIVVVWSLERKDKDATEYSDDYEDSPESKIINKEK